MKIFISWSGERSKKVAEALREWIPKVVQAADPWSSTEDIRTGTRWGIEIAARLKECSYGIICITPENRSEPWLLFESGALSKLLESATVCPYLLDLKPTDIQDPLAQFNGVQADEEGTWKLLQSINATTEKGKLSDQQLKETFELWWPKLEEKLKAIRPGSGGTPKERPERELLEDILNHVRTLNRSLAPPSRWQMHFEEWLRTSYPRQHHFSPLWGTVTDDELALLAASLNKPTEPQKDNEPEGKGD